MMISGAAFFRGTGYQLVLDAIADMLRKEDSLAGV
jgi:hypothetical protein